MRRWLSIVLLLMLPLQSGWAALGSYCQHETGIQAEHPGHHPHQHSASDADSSDAGGAHADCHSCLSAGMNALLPGSLAELSTAPAALPLLLPYPRVRPDTPPERPDRARLA